MINSMFIRQKYDTACKGARHGKVHKGKVLWGQKGHYIVLLLHMVSKSQVL